MGCGSSTAAKAAEPEPTQATAQVATRRRALLLAAQPPLQPRHAATHDRGRKTAAMFCRTQAAAPATSPAKAADTPKARRKIRAHARVGLSVCVYACVRRARARLGGACMCACACAHYSLALWCMRRTAVLYPMVQNRTPYTCACAHENHVKRACVCA